MMLKMMDVWDQFTLEEKQYIANHVENCNGSIAVLPFVSVREAWLSIPAKMTLMRKHDASKDASFNELSHRLWELYGSTYKKPTSR